jgi:hypothetical protein
MILWKKSSGHYISRCSSHLGKQTDDSGQRELCTPLVRHSTPIRHLGKNRRPETEYYSARNSFFPQVWRLRAHHFFTLLWKKGQVFDTTVTEIRGRSHDHPSMMIGSSLFGTILKRSTDHWMITNGSVWENDPEAIPWWSWSDPLITKWSPLDRCGKMNLKRSTDGGSPY